MSGSAEGTSPITRFIYRSAFKSFEQGFQLAEQGRYEEAICTLDGGLRRYAGDYVANFVKGLSLEHLGRREEALDSYNRSIQLNPQNHGLYKNKARVLYDLQRYQEAIDCASQSIALNPNKSNSHNSRNGDAFLTKANALRQLGRHEEALEAYNSALFNRDDESMLYRARMGEALSLVELKRYPEAADRAYAAHSCLESPHSKSLASILEGDAWSKCGPSYVHHGETAYNKALYAYETAAKIDPSNFLAASRAAAMREKIDRINKEREIQRQDEADKENAVGKDKSTQLHTNAVITSRLNTVTPRFPDPALGHAQAAEAARMRRGAWDYAQRSGLGTPGNVPNPYNAPPGYYQVGKASNTPRIGPDGRPIPPTKPPGTSY